MLCISHFDCLVEFRYEMKWILCEWQIVQVDLQSFHYINLIQENTMHLYDKEKG